MLCSLDPSPCVGVDTRPAVDDPGFSHHRRFEVAAELRLRVAKFGATPEDRARLRLEIDPEAHHLTFTTTTTVPLDANRTQWAASTPNSAAAPAGRVTDILPRIPAQLSPAPSRPLTPLVTGYTNRAHADLVRLAKSHGLPATGATASLIARMQADDRNPAPAQPPF